MPDISLNLSHRGKFLCRFRHGARKCTLQSCGDSGSCPAVRQLPHTVELSVVRQLFRAESYVAEKQTGGFRPAPRRRCKSGNRTIVKSCMKREFFFNIFIPARVNALVENFVAIVAVPQRECLSRPTQLCGCGWRASARSFSGKNRCSLGIEAAYDVQKVTPILHVAVYISGWCDVVSLKLSLPLRNVMPNVMYDVNFVLRARFIPAPV